MELMPTLWRAYLLAELPRVPYALLAGRAMTTACRAWFV